MPKGDDISEYDSFPTDNAELAEMEPTSEALKPSENLEDKRKVLKYLREADTRLIGSKGHLFRVNERENDYDYKYILAIGQGTEGVFINWDLTDLDYPSDIEEELGDEQ